jgi:hypothetical protein
VLSLTFAYSAWATFGMVPYALYATLNGKKEFKLALNLFNIGVPILMLAVFGSFYMTSIGSQGHNGLIFSLYPDETLVIMVLYIIFIFVEFGAYYLIMGRSIVKYEYFAITLTELIVIPLFVVRDFNFELRASLPALFMTMVYVIKYLLEYRTDKKLKYRRYALIIALCCGMMTPLTEINRTIYRTLSSDDILMEQIGSFGDIQTSEEQYINTVKDLYFAYDYEDTVFFKYLAKH